MLPSTEHAVIAWTRAFASVTRRAPIATATTDHGTHFETRGSGPARALLALGYDLYCLQVKDKLPEPLIMRLRDRRQFQSARYEIAIAGIMLRAGFEIRLIDLEAWDKKHCEFEATHRTTGLRVAVEAKSRVRPGALHQPGELAHAEDVSGLFNLVKKAAKQGLEGVALVIFLDVNLPPSNPPFK